MWWEIEVPKRLPNYGKRLSIGNPIFGSQMAIKFTQNLFPTDPPLFSKTLMNRVEGENSRLQHYLSRLHRKTFCDYKSKEMLCLSIKLLIYYLGEKRFSAIIGGG